MLARGLVALSTLTSAHFEAMSEDAGCGILWLISCFDVTMTVRCLVTERFEQLEAVLRKVNT
jgi:hypothetical protein